MRSTQRGDLIDVLVNWVFTLLFLPLTLLYLVNKYGADLIAFTDVKLLLELIFVGMLPLLIVWFRGEPWVKYGFTAVKWKNSVLYGLISSVPFLVPRVYAYFFASYRGWSWSLEPLKFLFYILVYGLLEAFFIVFSVYKIDKVFMDGRLFSRGVLLSSVLFGLIHGVNYIFVPDIVLVFRNYVFVNIVPAFMTGVLFKKTRSIIASCVLWTIINFT
jgi:hypothetical protein